MDRDRIEAEADSNNCTEAEMESISDTSSEEVEAGGRRELKKRMKLRSIKLSRLPSFGSCIRPQKSPSTHSPIAMLPDAAPNYTKATNCSDAKKGGCLQRRSSFKSKKSLTRIMSSKRKLKKTKVASFKSSSGSSTTTEETAQHDHQPCIGLKASSPNSESSVGSNDLNSTTPVRVLKKTSSLRPQRILTKTASLKSKRPARNKYIEIPDSNVERATCSSTLKDNKFPRQFEVKTGGDLAKKVCPYTYCSLHGHRHGALPPLKRFVSMRRRLLKNQKNMKPESRSIPKAKRSTNTRKAKATHISQMVCNGDYADKETAQNNRANSSLSEIRASSHSGEDKHIGDCATSHPHLTIEQHKPSDSLNTKPETQMAFSAVEETSGECCCNTDKKGQISASSAQSGDDEPILSVSHHKFTETSLPELKDSIQCDNLYLKLDGIVSSPNEKVPMDEEANGDRGLNLEVFEGNFESNIQVMEASTISCEPDNNFLKGNSPSGDCTNDEPHIQMEKRKYTRLWGLIYQHMKSGIDAEVETELPLDGKDTEEQLKDENALLRKNESVCFQRQSLSGTDQKRGTREYDAGDQKFEPWQSDAIKLVKEAFDKILSEIPDNTSDDQSTSSDVTSEQDLLEKNHGEGGERSILSSFEGSKESIKQNSEECETEAVGINSKTSDQEKVPSKQENKSSQQISKNWSNLKKVIILKRFVKALEKVRNINPRKPQSLPLEPDPETEKVNLRHQTLEERKSADEWMLDYALRQVISELAPAQKRKVALLVQAFETVTLPTDIKTRLSFNAESSSHATPVSNISTAEQQIPGTCSELKEGDLSGSSHAEVDMPACEAAQTNLEDEETVAFNLERKDHNSTLMDDQPALVDISPARLEEPGSSSKPSSQPDDIGSTSPEEFPVNGKIHPEVSKELILIHDSKICDIKFNSKKLETGNLIDADGDQPCELKSELSSTVSSVVSSAPFSSACGGEANSQYEVLRKVSPPAESEPHDAIDKDNLIDADGEHSCEPKSELSSIVCSMVSSASFSKLSEESMAASGGQPNPKHGVRQQPSPQEESESHDINDMQPEYKLEKQKYMRLWYLVYKHMVSSSAEDGGHSLEGADKEEQRGDTNKSLGTEDADSRNDSSEMNQKMLMDNQLTSSQLSECRQIEAIKLIEEAIDDIHLPEIQDDSTDNQSITGNNIPEQDFQKKHVESRDIFLSKSTDYAENSFRESNNTKVEQGPGLDPKETWLDPKNISALEKSETESKLEHKSKLQTQKSWSNLKKMILLKRFIKALEKVRKFNPREPQYLPLHSDPEAEKVNLRHQSMEDRKNAEEWMLDHALQQVVAKLTPARKRKVELLIEAFETVTPQFGSQNSSTAQYSSFSSCETHACLI